MTDFTGFLEAAKSSVTPLVEQANEIATRVKNADNVNALVHQVRDEAETTDEKILAYRDWFDKANLEILRRQKEVEDYIVDNNMVDTEPVDVDALTAQYKVLAEQIKGIKKAVATLPGAADIEMPDLISISTRGGGGSTGPRPRIQEIKLNGTEVTRKIKQKDGSYRQESNFTTLALHLAKTFKGSNVQVKELQQAAFDEAKTTDLSTLSGTPFSFAFTVEYGPENERKSENVMIEVTPAMPK